MKKFFTWLVLSILMLSSCKKDLSENALEKQFAEVGNVVTLSQVNVTSASNGDLILRIDITGQVFENPCTGGDLTALSGILQFNIAPDGTTIRSTVNSKLVMQDADGNIYHGVFVETFELNGSISQGTLHDTLRFILNPQGGGNKLNLHSMFHITINANGEVTADVEKFALTCG